MMRTTFYRITCLTNMHMGSGDANYTVVDLEVELDPVLKEPTMNASGVKGALRDFCREQAKANNISDEEIEYIFGSEGNGKKQGAYNFFSGDLLARPVRVTYGNTAYVLATTPELLKHAFQKIQAFGLCKDKTLTLPEPADGEIYSPVNGLKEVEGIAVKECDSSDLIETLLGTGNWAIMQPRVLKDISLPVLAHNVLKDHVSKNLWYEEVVPHESVFAMLIRGPEEGGLDELLCPKDQESIVQFGAGATTGNGFTRVSKVWKGGDSA